MYHNVPQCTQSVNTLLYTTNVYKYCLSYTKTEATTMGIGDLYPFVLTLVLVGMITGIGVLV